MFKYPSRSVIIFVPALILILALHLSIPASQRAHPPAPRAQGTGLRFAVIGDYGLAGAAESDVAALVKSWQPDLVLTVGDNNYPLGAASTIDTNIGQYYHAFISPYAGAFGTGAPENAFFPVLGNHDWYAQQAQPYLDFFTLPGNERYYNFVRGPVEFFMLDSDPNEPDGITASSAQAAWLEGALASSIAPWKIVLLHHAPYSSGLHGSTGSLQWPFLAWGADGVIAGHDHTYERMIVHGLPYFVDGLGGGPIYSFGTPVAGSLRRYNSDYGAMLVDASATDMVFQFVTRAGTVVDTYRLPFMSISGNAGVAGASLSYVDGTTDTVVADDNGDYSLRVSYGWMGTVTPSKTGFTFSPPGITYGGVISDQAGQNYDAAPYPGAGRYDDTDAHWTSGGTWVTVPVAGVYGGTLRIGASQGALATFPFTGNGFELHYLQYTNWGRIGITLDGSLTPLKIIDTSGPAGVGTYVSPLVAPGAHTVTFQHAGPAGSYVAIDSLDVSAPTYFGSGRYDDADAAWNFAGTWGAPAVAGAYNDTLHIAVSPGSTGTFYFVGTSFTLSYLTYPNWGQIEVVVDGKALTTLNTNAPAGITSYASPTFTAGTHTLELIHNGPSGKFIAFDCITIP